MDMKTDNTESVDRAAELLALARLVAFALESARTLDAEVAEFCLDKALRAVLEQIDEPTRMLLTTTDIMLMNQTPVC